VADNDAVDVTVLYIDGCPGWRTAEARVREALAVTCPEGGTVESVRVRTEEDAVRLRFPGSPTIRVGDRDLFPTASTAYAIACRRYPTPDGFAPSPTVDQLVEALS
jgi:hypothetical protein